MGTHRGKSSSSTWSSRNIAVGQHIVTQLLRIAQPGAMPQHDPGMGAQDRNVVSNGLALAGPTPMLTMVMPLWSLRSK